MRRRETGCSAPSFRAATTRLPKPSGRRDLNSGPLVPQNALALGRGVARCGVEWTKCLQIAGVRESDRAFLHAPTPDVWATIGQRRLFGARTLFRHCVVVFWTGRLPDTRCNRCQVVRSRSWRPGRRRRTERRRLLPLVSSPPRSRPAPATRGRASGACFSVPENDLRGSHASGRDLSRLGLFRHEAAQVLPQPGEFEPWS
jgi:hypothetical protein